ncbi:MAG: glycosyltransferase [Phycisphaerae bacterium]
MARSAWLLWYVMERMLGWFTEGLITMNRYDHELARDHRFIRRRDSILRANGVGVDAGHFDRLCRETDAGAVKRELGLAPNAPMVLLLAWTLPNKGIREFLEAARRLVDNRVPGCFVIGGHGPLDGEIAGFIDRHGLNERVFHLGWRRDAHRLIAACDVYVLPTYYPEGMPVSILEAMACGRPVVATRHRGCEDEVVDGVTGLLVEPQDPGALAEAIRTLIEDPDKARRFGQAGRRRIDEGFRTDQSTRAILAAFEKITAHGS